MHPPRLPVRFSLIVTVSALALSACGGAPARGLAADLPGSSWTLERVVLDDGRVVRGDGDQVTFAADGALSLASCNSCSGRYELRDDVLTVDAALACTKRACAPGAVELERYLGGTATVSRDGDYLVVEPAAGRAQQVLFVPASTPRASR